VASKKTITLVKFREPCSRLRGNKIRAQAGIAQRAADDLLYFAFMEVNAWTKHPPKLNSVR
jgi:hypothetical protein